MMANRTLAVVSSALSPDPRQAALQARAAGFAGLLFDAYSRAISFPDLSLSGRREFGHLLSSHQQKLVGLRIDLGANGFAPGCDVERILSRFEGVLEAAAGLRAGCICTDLGPLPTVPVESPQKPKITPQQAGLIILPDMVAQRQRPEPQTTPSDPEFVARVISALIELGRRADRYSVPIAFSTSLSGFTSLRQALKTANCPWFGVDLDPVAILGDPWDIDEVFSSLGGLIHHVRARDAVVGDDRRTRPAAIGQGSVPWGRILRAVDEAGYQGAITIDPSELPDRAAAAVAARKYLQTLDG